MFLTDVELYCKMGMWTEDLGEQKLGAYWFPVFVLVTDNVSVAIIFPPFFKAIRSFVMNHIFRYYRTPANIHGPFEFL